jgi:predicted LPLAT superfamily acyltransferase
MFPLGPFLLSHLAGAPILPGFVVREKWLRYKVIMGEPIYVQETEDRELYSLSAARQAVAFLEDNVRTYDDQWLNFFDFWAAQGASDRGDRNRIDHG